MTLPTAVHHIIELRKASGGTAYKELYPGIAVKSYVVEISEKSLEHPMLQSKVHRYLWNHVVTRQRL